jgi:hypothetical protein
MQAKISSALLHSEMLRDSRTAIDRLRDNGSPVDMPSEKDSAR